MESFLWYGIVYYRSNTFVTEVGYETVDEALNAAKEMPQAFKRNASVNARRDFSPVHVLKACSRD